MWSSAKGGRPDNRNQSSNDQDQRPHHWIFSHTILRWSKEVRVWKNYFQNIFNLQKFNIFRAFHFCKACHEDVRDENLIKKCKCKSCKYGNPSPPNPALILPCLVAGTKITSILNAFKPNKEKTFEGKGERTKSAYVNGRWFHILLQSFPFQVNGGRWAALFHSRVVPFPPLSVPHDLLSGPPSWGRLEGQGQMRARKTRGFRRRQILRRLRWSTTVRACSIGRLPVV